MPRCLQIFAWVLCLVSAASLIAQNDASGSDSSESKKAQVALLQSDWESSPEDMRLALVLARTLQSSNRTREARSVVIKSIEALERLLEAEGESGERLYLLGTGALFLKRNYTAVARFQQALSLQPEREENHQGLIRAQLNLEKLDEARAALDLATVLFPESEGLKRQHAELEELAGAPERAVPILEELHAINPDDRSVFNKLLQLYIETGNAEQASPMFDQLVEKGRISEMEAVLQVFRIHLKQGDLRAARVELQRAVDISADDPLVGEAFKLYYATQAIEAEKEDNYRRAALFWERALERAPDDWQTHYRMALAHAKLSNHEEALEYYLPLLEQQPTDPIFYADLSLSLTALKRFEASDRVVQLGIQAAGAMGNAEPAIARLREAHAVLSRAVEETNASQSSQP